MNRSLIPALLRRGVPVALSATFIATLSACGGGGNAALPTDGVAVNSLTNGTGTNGTTTVVAPPASTLALSGRVMNVGYLAQTQVCLDADDDGLCGASEASTTTDAAGRYSLTLPLGLRGAKVLAVVRPSSVDTASTTDQPVQVSQGWTLAAPLEYADGVTTATQNISPLTTTYYARLRAAGRNRLSNQIAIFTRVVFETNLNPSTGKLVLPVDFDYVANPRNALSARLLALHGVMNARASAAAAPLPMLMSVAVHNAWYNTYTGPTSTAAGVPVDAARIATFASTSTSTPEYYVANDYHYFRTNTPAAQRMREGLAETAGWVRKTGEGALASIDRRATTLSAGAVVYELARWAEGIWTRLTVDEGSHITLNAAGAPVVNAGTDYLQPRTITATDGNRVSFRNYLNNGVWGFDVSDSPGTSFFINEWVDEQGSYTTYYNGTAPTVASLTAAPAQCNLHYPNSTAAAQNTNTTTGAGTGTTASAWYATCFDYYLAEYYDREVNDLALTVSDPAMPGAEFYDATLAGSLVVAAARKVCVNPSPNAADTVTQTLGTVTTLGLTHCNWVGDRQGGHTVADLFRAEGVQVNSWSKYYGTTAFTSSGVTTTRVAGTPEQAGLPQQLTLQLQRNGQATSGTGTLTSPYGAWTATSFGATTETIVWEISPENPNMVLVSWPFRDAGDPRVKTTVGSDGTSAIVAAPLLPAGQFGGAVWNGNTFSAAPSTHTAPNYRKLAFLVVDGHIVSGQYYGDGYTYTERYFTRPAMEEGIKAMNYILKKLYAAGFTDQ